MLGPVPAEKMLRIDGLALREGSRSACRKMLATLPKIAVC